MIEPSTKLPEPEAISPANDGFWSYRRHRELDFFPTGKLRWWLLALIVFAWSIEQFERLKIGPVLIYVFEEFGVGLTQWGNVAAVAAVVQASGAYILSNLAEKYGRRPVIIWPIVVYLFIAVASAVAPNFGTLAVLYVAGGFVVSGMSPAVHAAARDITPRVGRAMVYSWISLAFTIGALLSTWVASQTIPIWPGWRPQFWIAAVFAAVTVLVLWVFYRDLSMNVRTRIVRDQSEALKSDQEAPGETDLGEAQKSGMLVYRDLRLWLLSSAMLFWIIAYVTVSSYVPVYLTMHYDVHPAEASALTSYFWFLFTISVFVSGWISDKLQVRKTVAAFGGISTGICFILAANLPLGTSYTTLAIAWSCTGWFSGFIYPAWSAMLSENAEQISPFGVARAFGITAFLAVISGLLLNLGLPRIVDTYGWPTWMMLAGGSCFMIAFLVAFGRGPWLPPKRN